MPTGVLYPNLAYSSQTNKNDAENDKASPNVAKLKNPIVEKLWAARHKAKSMLKRQTEMDSPSSATTDVSKAAASCIDDKSNELKNISYEQQTSKTPSESETAIDYPFSSDEFLRETYVVSSEMPIIYAFQ